MSNPESFVDEVSEELRRDRLYQNFRRYGWVAVGLVLVLVGGAAYKEWSKSQWNAEAQTRGDGLLLASQTADATVIADDTNAIAALTRAAILIEAEDFDGAAAEYEKLSYDINIKDGAGADLLYRDLAVLRMAMLPNADPEIMREKLDTIAQAGRPFAILAQEQLAMIDLAADNRDTAVATLTSIFENADTGAGQKQRVLLLLTALGAEPDAQ